MKHLPITPHLYTLLSAEFPNLFTENPVHLRLLYHILFPSRVDEQTGLPLVPAFLLAHLEGKETAFRGHRYKAQNFLDRFEALVDGRVEIEPYEYTKGKARTAMLTISDELAQAVEEEMCLPAGTKLLDLVTGKRLPQQSITKARRAMRVTRQTYQQSTSSPSRMYAQWLNSLDVRVFESVKRNLDKAVEEARRIENPVKRRANLGTLFRMRHLDWVPTYKTTENTPRIYTEGSSPAGLSESVRKVLLGGGRATYSADLVAAQLAILAHIWNLPKTAEIVSQKGQVWPLLLAEADLNPEDKPALKTFVYSTAFGMADNALKYTAFKAFGKAKSEHLLATPIIQELLDGRRQRQEEMKRDRGFTDVFGTFRSLDDVLGKQGQGRKTRTEEEGLRMLMAYEAQAYEFSLMEPVLKIAMETSEVRILFWLHDGVYFSVTQPERADYYRERIERAVNERAANLGINTELAVDDTSD